MERSVALAAGGSSGCRHWLFGCGSRGLRPAFHRRPPMKQPERTEPRRRRRWGHRQQLVSMRAERIAVSGSCVPDGKRPSFLVVGQVRIAQRSAADAWDKVRQLEGVMPVQVDVRVHVGVQTCHVLVAYLVSGLA